MAQNKHYFVTSVMRVYGFPPYLVPVEDLEDFNISPNGALQCRLKSTVHRQAQDFCLTYCPEISGTMNFGRITGVHGLFLSKNTVSMPVDSLTVVWDPQGAESLEVVMGPARATIPGSAFGHMNPGSRLPSPHSAQLQGFPDASTASPALYLKSASMSSRTRTRHVKGSIDIFATPRNPPPRQFPPQSGNLKQADSMASRPKHVQRGRSTPAGDFERSTDNLSGSSSDSFVAKASTVSNAVVVPSVESPAPLLIPEEPSIVIPSSKGKEMFPAVLFSPDNEMESRPGIIQEGLFKSVTVE